MESQELHLSGMWKIPGEKARAGILICNDTARTIRLKVQEYCPRGSGHDLNYWPRVKDLGLVIGNVGVDGKMVLCGCKPQLLRANRARGGRVYEFEIAADYAFRDYKLGKKHIITMKGVSVDFGEILAWTRTSAYQLDMSNHDEDFWLHRWKSKEFGYKFSLPNGGVVSFLPYDGRPGAVMISREVVLSQGVRTGLYYKTSREWVLIRDDIELVRHLVEFAMTTSVGIIEASFSQARDKWFRKKFEPKDYKQILLGDKIVGKTRIPRDDDMVFTLPELMAVIAKTKRRWRKNFGDLRLAFKLYDEVIRKESDGVEGTFVRLVQLLEHLHSLIFSDKMSLYEKRMREVWGDDDKMFECEKHRLCGTRNPDRPNLKMRLYEMTRNNRKWLVANPIGDDGIAFAEKVAKTRHYFIHHNVVDEPKSFPADKVEEVIWFLRSLVRYHILRKLGFSEDFALRRMGWSKDNSRELFSLIHVPIGEEKINV